MFVIKGTTWQKCQTRTPEIVRPFTSSRNSYFKNEALSKKPLLWNEFYLHENKELFSHQLFWVRSIGKSGFRLYNTDFVFTNEREIRKRDFNAEISVFAFPFYCKIGKFDKVFLKIAPKNSGLTRACIISKKKTAFHENSFANPFFGFQMVKRKSMKSGFGFLNWNPPWEWISRSIAKSKIGISKCKSWFPSWTQS